MGFKARAHRPVELPWRPEILDAGLPGDRERLERYWSDSTVSVLDAYAAQLRDLIKARTPRQDLSHADLDARVRAELGAGTELEHGRWIFYPWSRRLVHALAPRDFVELRSNRNQHKIVNAERDRLRQSCIGIVGLSVGHSAALTLTLEGIGGRFRLADFDALDLSNLNRIRTGVHNLGVNKAIVAAREMFEIDPYLDIEIFADGITEANLDGFFEGDCRLDLLVEECDDLFAKVRLRERARDLGIPVVMDTSDGGMLDIERFDLEPERELFHGAVPGIRASDLKGLTTKEKVPFVLAILGARDISAELAGSMVEIKKTVSTWPQLGSSVTLGGALVADSVRRILLRTMSSSGRFRVNLEDLVHPDAVHTILPSEALNPRVALSSQQLPEPPGRPKQNPLLVDDSILEYLLQFAIRAPSGGNAQPWRFEWESPLLRCYVDPSRTSLLDFEYRASKLAIGAALENVRLAAEDLGLHSSLDFTDTLPNLACTMTLERGQTRSSPLLAQVFRRVTNRRLGDGSRLDAVEIEALRDAARDAGGFLLLLQSRQDMAEMGSIAGQVDRLRFLSPKMHAELVSELRWTAEDAERTLDGIDLATLEVDATDRAILHVLARGDVMRFLEDLKMGEALEDPARKANEKTSAIALITVPKGQAVNYVHGGMVMERVWLTATQLGLGVWPQGVINFLLARVEDGKGVGLRPHEVEIVKRLGDELRHLFQVPRDQGEIMIFRLSRVPPPTAYSLRRSLGDVWQARSRGL